MSIRLVKAIQGSVDGQGVVQDGIWRIRTHEVPDRFTRLRNGAQSLQDLLHKYSFRDRVGCAFSALGAHAHEATARSNLSASNIEFGRSLRLRSQKMRRLYAEHLPGFATVPCEHIVRVKGVPQRTHDSGLCWWGSLLYGVCTAPEVKRLFAHAMERSDLKEAKLFRRALDTALEEPVVAKSLHDTLHHGFGIGDKPGISPAEEGQNGFTQLAMIAKVFDIPMITLSGPQLHDISSETLTSEHTTMKGCRAPESGEVGLLGVRIVRARWKPETTLSYGGSTWKLQFGFLGSEFCHHQTCLVRICDGWAFYDSDGCRMKIGPLVWKSHGNKWWEDLLFVMPFSNETEKTRFCDFSPHNRHAMQIFRELYTAHGAHDPTAGVDLTKQKDLLLNVDWVYTKIG